MAKSIAYTKNYTAVLDEVYKRVACSTCLNSPRRMARAGRNAKEIMVPKIEVTGLGDYTRNVGYKTGSILFITPTLKGVLDDFSLANPARSNRVLERFSRIVEVPQTRFWSAIELNSGEEDQFGYSRAEGSYQLTEDTSVVSGKTYYTKSGEQYTPVSSPASGSLSSYYELVGAGAPINFMVVERSAVIKFDKHVASRVFSPDELENLDSYMMKYRKYGIVELLDNKLDGVYVSAATE